MKIVMWVWAFTVFGAGLFLLSAAADNTPAPSAPPLPPCQCSIKTDSPAGMQGPEIDRISSHQASIPKLTADGKHCYYTHCPVNAGQSGMIGRLSQRMKSATPADVIFFSKLIPSVTATMNNLLANRGRLDYGSPTEMQCQLWISADGKNLYLSNRIVETFNSVPPGGCKTFQTVSEQRIQCPPGQTPIGDSCN